MGGTCSSRIASHLFDCYQSINDHDCSAIWCNHAEINAQANYHSNGVDGDIRPALRNYHGAPLAAYSRRTCVRSPRVFCPRAASIQLQSSRAPAVADKRPVIAPVHPCASHARTHRGGMRAIIRMCSRKRTACMGGL